MAEPTLDELLSNLNAQQGLPSSAADDDAAPQYAERRDESEFASIESELLSSVEEKEPKRPTGAGQLSDKPEFKPDPKAQVVAADIGEGIIELPLQVAGGIVDAVNETSDFAYELGSWLTENVADLGQIVINGDGISFEKGMPGANSIQLPTTDKADSVTGGIFRNISKFLAGFFGAGKLKPVQMIKPTTSAGKFGKAALQAGIADATVFDPHEERLSNLVQSVPALENPISEFLAADPTDNAAFGRFKNAMEGLGLGVITEGLVRGLKTIRSMRKAKASIDASGISKEVPQVDVRKDLEILGNFDSEDLLIKQTKQKLEDVKGAKPGDVLAEPEGKTFINFARINTADDVKNVIQKMADDFKPQIDKARRGKVTFEQTKLNAEQKNAWDILLQRRKGQPLNDSESLAVRNLWVSSGEKLKEIATAAVNNPSKTNLYAFRKMMATHNAIQKEVISARTETARALNAWKIPAEGNATMLSHIDDLLESNGSTDIALDLAKRVKALAEMGDEAKLTKFVEQGAFAKSRNAVLQVWINDMLSAPATHLVNAMSNWSVAALQIAERKGAAYLGRALGHEDTVQMGEATAQVFGLVEGIKDSLRISAKGRTALRAAGKQIAEGKLSAAKKTLKQSEDEFGGVFRSLGTGESGFGLNKVEAPNVGALSSEVWNVSSDTWLGRGMDMIDSVTRFPGRMLAVGDEFFKSMGYRMELHAQALRQASNEVRDGVIKPDAVKKRIAEIIENPPENIRLEAADAALYQTFTKNTEWLPNKIAKNFQQIPVLGRILLPFRRTPVNILSFALERTPMAPVVKEFRADIAAGGARRDIALSRMATGTMILLAAADMRMNGTITGGGTSDSGERQLTQRMGIQPYSVKVGDRYWSYGRADPIGMTLGISADAVDIITNSMEDDTEIEGAMVAASLAIAKNVTSKTYLRGLSQFFDAVSDPDRYGNAYFQGLAGSVVPAGLAAYARVEDPHLKIAGNMLDKIKSRTPWWNDEVPNYHDLWGRPVTYQSGLGKAYDFISPIYSRTENPEAVDKELERLGYFPRLPRKDVSFEGVTVNMRKHPHAFQRLVQLAGNEVKHPAWELGAKDFLNQVVSGKHAMSEVYNLYSDGPDGGKAAFIEKTINDYRDLAKKKVLKEFPEIKAEVDNGNIMFKKLNPEVLGLQ